MALRAAPSRGRWLARALAAPGAARVPPLSAASARPLAGLRPLPPAARFASTAGQGPEAEGPQRRVVVVRITSPFAWLRTRFYYLLIRLYFDQEFSIEEFTRGAKQAFSVVSKLLSQRKLDLLDELVSAEVLQVLKEKISLLPDNHRDALAADIDAIMYTTEGDVRIYYDDDAVWKAVWELKAFTLRLCRTWFQREFTEGVKPDWTITRIEHPRLLE
ncbi:m-AAA protease-interacting protein 1, mitochondrial isoform X3 [Calonectris borealis]|uniref:m-AAA protease-interacting protein 1, mitochondrial isoform X3 n=1 Tax=Calonectris borealis TaxID=1323832 RepID=UPI003F4B47FB